MIFRFVKKHYLSVAGKRRFGFTLMEIVLVMGIFSTTLLLVTNIFVGSAKIQQRTIAYQRMTGDARYTVEAIARAIRSGGVDYSFYFTEEYSASAEETINLRPTDAPLHILATVDQDGNRTIFRRRSLDPEGDPWGLREDANGISEVGDTVEVCMETNICVEGDDYLTSTKDACNTDSDCTAEGETCALSCRFSQAWSNITPAGVRLTGGSNHTDESYGLKFIIYPEADPNELENDLGGYKASRQPFVEIMLMTAETDSQNEVAKTTFIQTAVSSRIYRR